MCVCMCVCVRERERERGGERERGERKREKERERETYILTISNIVFGTSTQTLLNLIWALFCLVPLGIIWYLYWSKLIPKHPQNVALHFSVLSSEDKLFLFGILRMVSAVLHEKESANSDPKDSHMWLSSDAANVDWVKKAGTLRWILHDIIWLVGGGMAPFMKSKISLVAKLSVWTENTNSCKMKIWKDLISASCKFRFNTLKMCPWMIFFFLHSGWEL